MKRTLSIIGFVVLAGAVLGWGIWYSGKISEQSAASSTAAGQAAQEANAKIMENFKVKDIAVGTGAEVKNGQSVTVNYEGTLDNGVVFDSSYKRSQPFTFTIGAGQVIKGWDMGVLGMRVGGKRELTIPPELGYGARAVGPIPPNSTLHFVVEVLTVK